MEIAARTAPPPACEAPASARPPGARLLPRRGQLVDVADLPGLLKVGRLDRRGGLPPLPDSLLCGVQHEDLEAAGRFEHHLAVVRDDRAPRQSLHLAHEGGGHEVLEAHPDPAHEIARAAVAQRHLGGGQDVLEDHEDVVVEDPGPRSRRTLAVELAHDAHDRVGQGGLQLAGGQRLVVLHASVSIPAAADDEAPTCRAAATPDWPARDPG